MKKFLAFFIVGILGASAFSQQQSISNIQSTSIGDSASTLKQPLINSDSSKTIRWPKVTYTSGFWKNKYYVDDLESTAIDAERYICQCPASKDYLHNAKGLFILSRILFIAGSTAALISAISYFQSDPFNPLSRNKPNYTGDIIGIGLDILSFIPFEAASSNYSNAFDNYNNNCRK